MTVLVSSIPHAERVTKISEWMRFWAPEVKKRADAESPNPGIFSELVRVYKELCKNPGSEELSDDCLTGIQVAQEKLNQAPPGAYDYLAHIGTFIP